ncbi:MAG: Phospholipase D1 [Sclerophora amabilis]|nr:MAG: Phospholipase D1 [Sclerophora amabilis]
MADSRDASISPMAMSPRSTSPNAPMKPTTASPKALHHSSTSRLRTHPDPANITVNGSNATESEEASAADEGDEDEAAQTAGSINERQRNGFTTSGPVDRTFLSGETDPQSADPTPEGKITGTNGSVPPIRNARGPDPLPVDMSGQSPQTKHTRKAAGSTTPPGRRSVQFARPGPSSDHFEPSHSRGGSGSWDVEVDTPTKEWKGSTLFSKLRSMTSSNGLQGHGRSQSGITISGDSVGEGTSTVPLSPDSEREGTHFSDRLEDEEKDADADAEESAGEDRSSPNSSRKRRRRGKRLQDGGTQTAPTTPRTPADRTTRHGGKSSPLGTPTDVFRPPFLRRRATMTDIPENNRAGVSEDEGRNRINKESTWRRGSAWVHGGRGQSFVGHRNHNQDDPESRRPSNFRRLTGLGGNVEGAEGASTAAWKHRAERTSNTSAQKWRQLKAGLKMMGQKRKEESKIDNAKSAELLAELTAGVPAALMLASMFQRDERGNKRIPILLEQLKCSLTDSKKVEHKSSGDRHVIFRIEMEYGSGLTRMKWVIHRALRDFANLHLRYRLQAGNAKQLYVRNDTSRSKLPRFPRTVFPYLRGVRGLGSEDEDDVEEGIEEDTGSNTIDRVTSASERHGKRRKKRPSIGHSRRSSHVARSPSGDLTTGVATGGGQTVASLGVGPGARRDTYPERQRKKLEVYLQQMVRHFMFRPESNRLCKFLELSSLGVRLAAEGSYHGKEGFLIIQSAKGLDFRRGWNPSLVAKRHAPKWFLVRHSYIVCVDSPEEMNIYDVFLVDSEFHMMAQKRRLRDSKPKDIAASAKSTATHPQHHGLKIKNSERKVKLLAKNERQLHQFEESIKFMSSNTIWAKRHRFDSFAPTREGVFVQWLVDGRDYMWNVSRAISMARDVIYIHDWWLSPELYMRRPAAISQKWRLDRLLQRKANEGVKIFVIVYRNINSAIPIDSSYTKFSLLDLHPNVFVQRSPNQIRQNTFFWAHHEKICIVDHAVAFVGGIDLCFGRWDTPQHSLCDDKLTGFELSDMPKDADHCQLWPGKDYSNPRVQDFYALDKPYEEMYDRTKVARMPWHDISMQVVGQPARDLTRHFVQRWNYVLRQRKPTRPTPFLLPPPDFNPADLEALGLNGTCEVQILRSCCWWSIGTPDKTEHSIMNAYIKMIEQSEHFVYIENQFFVSSCEVEGTKIENLIGDALVERIVRASKNGEEWRAIILIPLMPGFQNTVDSQDGTSVRLIMQCQYRSICRGETSIFGRLRAQDIEPEDYIQFYSLRSWGKIGPNKMLVTEQVYIHAKCMIVDDRTAIIGSANINERSMLGLRDSECAAIVRDTDMLWSTMGGEPYLVGRFPHTLRMRLMREHLGLDVDEIMEGERQQGFKSPDDEWERDMDGVYNGGGRSPNASAEDKKTEQNIISSQHRAQDELLAKSEEMHSFNHDVDWEQADNPNLMTNKTKTEDRRVTGNEAHKRDVEGMGSDHMVEKENIGLGIGRDSALVRDPTRIPKEVLVADIAPEGKRTLSVSEPQKYSRQPSPSRPASEEYARTGAPLPPRPSRMSTSELALPTFSQLPALPKTDDTDIGGPPVQHELGRDSPDYDNPLVADMKRPSITKDCMKDPLNDSFFHDMWHTVAENNAKLYRIVFRCMPDNEVTSWKEYKEYAAYSERFAQAQGIAKGKARVPTEQNHRSGPPGQSTTSEKLANLGSIGEKVGEAGTKIDDAREALFEKTSSKKNKEHPMGVVEEWADEANQAHTERQAKERERKEEGSTRNSNSSQEVVNEKVTSLRSSDDSPTEFPRLSTAHETLESERGQPKQSLTSQVTHSDSLSKQKRRRRATTRSSKREFHASDDMMNVAQAESLMKMTQGHLVVWPYNWYVYLRES